MPAPEPRPRVTVEDLLRLKRAEKPDADFWPRFESELRQKQLAALVEHRRWWENLPQALVRRAYVPIGAAAALTISFVAVQEQVSVVPEDSLLPQHEERAAQPEAVGSGGAVASSGADLSTIAPLDQAPEAAVALRFSAELPPAASELVPWGPMRADETPSARSIAANLAQLAQTEPELANALLDSRLGEEGIGAASVAELAALSSAETRRSRVLAQFGGRQFVPEPTAPEVVRERHVRRLGDVEAGSGWTRVGVKADRVSLKF